MRNKGVTQKILESIASVALDSTALFVAINRSGYGASIGKIDKNTRKTREELDALVDKISAEIKKPNFYSTLSRLRRDGLVERKVDGWVATSLGKTKLFSKMMPIGRYKKEDEDILKIVMFDIPEKYRRKRAWLRERLVELGFKMLQKSVWTGKVKLPTEFMADLKRLDLLSHVDIVAVTKTGSLRHI